MAAIEGTSPDLDGVLPRACSGLPNDVLVELLRLLGRLPESIEGDGFGLIYEYFLGQFAFSEGRKGGEFFAPTSIVKLMAEIIEPYHGKIFDPACGSGGRFVQSAHLVERHRKDPGSELSVYGQEKTKETVRLAEMNLAVHGLAGDTREANTCYEYLHDSVGQFDFVMANPPFNVNKVDKAKLEDGRRFPFGLPKPDNASYLWIQTFYSALNEHGRAGFVMANSASDARGSEMEIRRRLIEDDVRPRLRHLDRRSSWVARHSCDRVRWGRHRAQQRRNRGWGTVVAGHSARTPRTRRRAQPRCGHRRYAPGDRSPRSPGWWRSDEHGLDRRRRADARRPHVLRHEGRHRDVHEVVREVAGEARTILAAG